MTSQLLLLLFLNFAFAVVLSFVLYPNLFKDKTQRVLALFRFLSFFLLGLLVINPKVDTTTYRLEKPKLIFTIDNSESVKKLSSPEEMNNFIAQLQADIELNNSYDAEFIKFGAGLRPFIDSLSFNEASTDISKVIDYANALEESNANFVMITDGNQTLGEYYNFKTFSKNLRANVLIIGDTTSYRDTKIDLVNVNNYAYFKNKFPIEVFVSQNTSVKTEQILKIIEDGKTLAYKTLEIPPNASLKTEFIITAEPVGMKVLKVVLEPLSGEKNQNNNKEAVSVEVIDSRSKVLLVSDLLHPDIGFFNRILDSNKELEFVYKTTDEPVQLSEYDLVIFYQPQSSFQNLITQARDQSINHFIIGGSHTNYRMLNGLDLGFQKELISSSEDYSSTLNSDFSLFLVNELDFKNYPPLKDKFGDIQLKKDYSTLLEKQINGIEVDSPLWVFKIENDVRQSILFGENIWRWRAKHYAENSSFTKFDQSFQKIIQFLSQSKFKNTLTVDVQPVLNSGENQKMKVTYYNSNFESDTRFDFDIVIENLDTGNVQTSRLIKRETSYVFDLSKLEPGNYTYKIESSEVDLKKRGQFQVMDYSSEMQFESANIESLQSLVGRENLYAFDNRDELISKLKANKPKAIQKSIKKSKSLINFEWLILLLALTLSLEWFFRKYKGLI